MRIDIATLLVLIGLASLAGCKKFEASAPAGFATFDDFMSSQFRAVSADGVTYRVRQEENEPEADLPFWREALKKRMLDAGYAFVSEAEVIADKRRGYLLELAAPVGEQDHTYLIALFRRGDTLVIAEAAGEVSRFAAHRRAIVAAIEALR